MSIINIKKITLAFILYLGVSQITSFNVHIYAEELPQIPPPVYSAASVVIMEASTGMVLYANSSDYIKYPASITKVMTALIVLEQVQDLEERILFSNRAIWGIDRTSSHIAMDVGETLSVYEALHAIMLPSANEVSMALAEHVAGTIEGFVDIMNRRAQALGAYDTHFVNPSGLPDAGHVTTAYDFALIMREAVRHPMFVDIIGARRFDIPPTERQPEVRALRNTNSLIQPGPLFNPSVVGSKTGWTNAAGHTLVTYAEQDGRRLIVTVLGGQSPNMFTDTTALLDYGFALPFKPTQIFNAAANTPTIPVYHVGADNARIEIGRVALRANEDIYFDLPPNFDTSLLRFNLSVPHALTAPVEAGESLGSVTVYVQNVRVGRATLLATETVLDNFSPAANPQTNYDTMVISNYEPPYATTPHNSLGVGGYLSPYYEDAPPFWMNEYVLTLAVPLAISFVTLLISLVIYIFGREKRMRKKLHERYARYPKYYRYR